MEENVLKRIEDEFSIEILNVNRDFSQDIGDIVIQNVFKNEIVEEIPVIKTISAIYNTGLAIRERVFAKKILAFLYEYQLGDLSPKELETFKQKMKEEDYKNRVIEILFIYLDKFSEFKKANLLSKLFIGYINKRINWDKFLHYCTCLDSLILSDLRFLITAARTTTDTDYIDTKLKNYNQGINRRLENLGLFESESLQAFAFGQVPVTTLYKLTPDGRLLVDCLQA